MSEYRINIFKLVKYIYFMLSMIFFIILVKFYFFILYTNKIKEF